MRRTSSCNTKTIPLKDLKALRGNDTFTITSLWLKWLSLFTRGHLQDAEAALNQALHG